MKVSKFSSLLYVKNYDGYILFKNKRKNDETYPGFENKFIGGRAETEELNGLSEWDGEDFSKIDPIGIECATRNFEKQLGLSFSCDRCLNQTTIYLEEEQHVIQLRTYDIDEDEFAKIARFLNKKGKKHEKSDIHAASFFALNRDLVLKDKIALKALKKNTPFLFIAKADADLEAYPALPTLSAHHPIAV